MAQALRTGERAERRSVRRECEASVVVTAPSEAVWEVVSDPSRVGEWSCECRGCAWVEKAHSSVPGAHFSGHNRCGRIRWTRLNEVVRADEPKELIWRTMRRWPLPDSVEWRFGFSDEGTGTRVDESFLCRAYPRSSMAGPTRPSAS
jgi:uncharacterized protein YndB with AHSA1/START domain